MSFECCCARRCINAQLDLLFASADAATSAIVLRTKCNVASSLALSYRRAETARASIRTMRTNRVGEQPPPARGSRPRRVCSCPPVACGWIASTSPLRYRERGRSRPRDCRIGVFRQRRRLTGARRPALRRGAQRIVDGIRSWHTALATSHGRGLRRGARGARALRPHRGARAATAAGCRSPRAHRDLLRSRARARVVGRRFARSRSRDHRDPRPPPPGGLPAALAGALEPLRPGGYDFARDLYFQRIGATGFVLGAITHRRAAGAAGLLAALCHAVQGIRDAIDARIRAAVPGDKGAIASALITGKRDAISAPVNDAMYVSSLAHVLSISGYHMALVAGVVFFVLRALLALFAVARAAAARSRNGPRRRAGRGRRLSRCCPARRSRPSAPSS